MQKTAAGIEITNAVSSHRPEMVACAGWESGGRFADLDEDLKVWEVRAEVGDPVRAVV